MTDANPTPRRPWLSLGVGLLFMVAAGALIWLQADYAREQTLLESARAEGKPVADYTPLELDERIDYLDAAQSNFAKKTRYLVLFTLIAWVHAANGAYRNYQHARRRRESEGSQEPQG